MAGIRRKNVDALALALASGDSVVEAAAKANMAERTAYRRAAEPGFHERVQTLRGDMMKNAMARLAAGMTEAVDVLRALLKASAESVRLSAARTLLDMGVKVRGAEMEERVNKLETILDQVRSSDESKPA